MGADTLAATIREALADDIVSGRIAPGARLDERDLADRFGASRTPVREALRQLAAVGLADMRPRRSVVAANLSDERLHELFEVMAEIEAVCARLAAERMSPTERRALEATHEACAREMRIGDTYAYHRANETFHNAVYYGSHNVALADQALSVRARLAPFRRAQFRVRGRLGGSVAEHDAVVQAILRGDGETAARAMRQHVSIVGVASADYLTARRADDAPALAAPPAVQAART